MKIYSNIPCDLLRSIVTFHVIYEEYVVTFHVIYEEYVVTFHVIYEEYVVINM
jgi:hypothetical protein